MLMPPDSYFAVLLIIVFVICNDNHVAKLCTQLVYKALFLHTRGKFTLTSAAGVAYICCINYCVQKETVMSKFNHGFSISFWSRYICRIVNFLTFYNAVLKWSFFRWNFILLEAKFYLVLDRQCLFFFVNINHARKCRYFILSYIF
jgi:hypothetical protein